MVVTQEIEQLAARRDVRGVVGLTGRIFHEWSRFCLHSARIFSADGLMGSSSHRALNPIAHLLPLAFEVKGNDMPRWTVLVAFLLALSGTRCVADGMPLQLATLEYPPYITEVDQQPQGFVVDIVKTAFARIELNRSRSSFPDRARSVAAPERAGRCLLQHQRRPRSADDVVYANAADESGLCLLCAQGSRSPGALMDASGVAGRREYRCGQRDVLR